MHPNVKRLLDKEYDEQRSEAWLKLRGNTVSYTHLTLPTKA